MNIQDPLKKKVSRNPRSSRPTLREPPLQRKMYTLPGAYRGSDCHSSVCTLDSQTSPPDQQAWPSLRGGAKMWLSDVNCKNSLHCQPGCTLEPPGAFENIPVPMCTPEVVTELVWGVAQALGCSELPSEPVEPENLCSALASPFLQGHGSPTSASESPRGCVNTGSCACGFPPDSGSSGLGWNPRIHIFIKVPGEADTVPLRTTNRRQSCSMDLPELTVSTGGVS